MVEKHRIGDTDFVWDVAKADSNRFRLGVRFEDAATVFMDPLLVLTDASRNDEARDAVIGFDQLARLLFVVHIEFEDASVRIISARPADAKEERLYDQ
jgi:uncharacterized DUF497 family protein